MDQWTSVEPSESACAETESSPAEPLFNSTQSPSETIPSMFRTSRARPSNSPMLRTNMLADMVSPLCQGPPFSDGAVEPADSNAADGISMLTETGNVDVASTLEPVSPHDTVTGRAIIENGSVVVAFATRLTVRFNISCPLVVQMTWPTKATVPLFQIVRLKSSCWPAETSSAFEERTPVIIGSGGG